MAITSGSLEDISFAEIVFALYSSRASGTLRVDEGRISKSIYFKVGQITFASSNDINDRLGEMLLRKGVITYKNLIDASKAIVKGKRFGTILVESGTLKAQQLIWAVKEQVKEIVFSIFPWLTGNYEFQEGALPKEEVITLTVNTPDIIKKGVESLERWDIVKAGLGDLEIMHSFAVPFSKIESQITLSDNEKALIKKWESPQTLIDTLANNIILDFMSFKLLWTMKILGYIVPYSQKSFVAHEELSSQIMEVEPEGMPEDAAEIETGINADDLNILLDNKKEVQKPLNTFDPLPLLTEITQAIRGELGATSLAFIKRQIDDFSKSTSLPIKILTNLQWSQESLSGEDLKKVAEFTGHLIISCKQFISKIKIEEWLKRIEKNE